MAALSLLDIAALFERGGGQTYSGENVTQLEHALQTAQRAQDAGADDELVTASLLHDLGHLLTDLGDTPSLRGLDDRHQHAALPHLRGLFSPRVLGTIALHVDAKRYLCATQPSYQAALSADSQRSLVLQGGVFDAAQAAAFGARPGAADAVKLRQWDDLAKIPGQATAPLSHFLERARRCALPLAYAPHGAADSPGAAGPATDLA